LIMSISPGLVCNASYSDTCSCDLANLTDSATFYTNCFVKYVCAYNTSTKAFCSGHGTCLFNESRCACDTDYGLTDCSGKYKLYEVSGLIKYPLIVLGALFVFVSLGLIYWVWKYRATSEVKAMSITFTNLMLLGCALVSGGVLVIGLGWNQTTCILVEWLSFIGITLVISCAGVKAFRIASIFNRKAFSTGDLTDKTLLKYLCGATSVSGVLLIIYTILNFTEGGAYFRELNSKTGPLLKEHRCSSQPITSVTYYIMVAYVLILLIGVLKYGNETRSASNIFKETQCIYLGSNIGTLIFIAFGVFILFTTNYSAQIAVRGFGTMIVIIVVIVLLFGPKMKAVYNSPPVVEDGLTEKERQLGTQYATTLRERSGKELMLVMTTLVNEMKYRLDNKMMTIEMTEQNFETLVELGQGLKKLLVTNTKSLKDLKQVSSSSDLISDKSEADV